MKTCQNVQLIRFVNMPTGDRTSLGSAQRRPIGGWKVKGLSWNGKSWKPRPVRPESDLLDLKVLYTMSPSMASTPCIHKQISIDKLFQFSTIQNTSKFLGPLLL